MLYAQLVQIFTVLIESKKYTMMGIGRGQTKCSVVLMIFVDKSQWTFSLIIVC